MFESRSVKETTSLDSARRKFEHWLKGLLSVHFAVRITYSVVSLAIRCLPKLLALSSAVQFPTQTLPDLQRARSRYSRSRNLPRSFLYFSLLGPVLSSRLLPAPPSLRASASLFWMTSLLFAVQARRHALLNWQVKPLLF